MNISAALTLIENLAPVFDTKGVDALSTVDALLKKGETLPAPFDKMTPYLKEAEVVVELFIAFEKMVFPAA